MNGNCKSCGCRKTLIAQTNGRKAVKHTFSDLFNICSKNQIIPNFVQDPSDKIFNTKRGNWFFTCKCGKVFTAHLNFIINGNTKSCGCLWKTQIVLNRVSAKNTFNDIINICNTYKLVFLNPIDINQSVFDTKASTWPIKCHCGKIWNPRLNDLLTGQTKSCGCVASLPQIEINNFIKNSGVKTIFNDRTTIYPLELDILIPDKNLAIEYCGLYWHGEKEGKKTSGYHKNKFLLCKSAGIRLITIFEDEWLSRRDIVEAYLTAILNKKSVKIGARKCVVQKVTEVDAMNFYNANHLQGRPKSGCKHFGLYNNQELIGMASYTNTNANSHRYNDSFELTRYCTKLGVTVQGGLSKIQKVFIKEFHPSKIISFSDNRWSLGNIYNKLGFKNTKEIKPDYKYFKNGTKGPLLHKNAFRKSNLNPNLNKTEWEIMKDAGYDRIWDCGKIRWELKL